MPEVSAAPDLTALEVPMDAWTQPVWEAAALKRLLLPRCAACHHFRWPPGPFCPHCQSQLTHWVEPGLGRVYSFTIVRDRHAQEAQRPAPRAPALIEFPDADGVRMLAAIVDTPIEDIRIGAEVRLGWSRAANVVMPVFCIRP
jgi:uncharacterized OB-fold protein